MKQYVANEDQLKKFVVELNELVGDSFNVSNVQLSDKFNPPTKGFDKELQIQTDGVIVVRFPFKLLGDQK